MKLLFFLFTTCLFFSPSLPAQTSEGKISHDPSAALFVAITLQATNLDTPESVFNGLLSTREIVRPGDLQLSASAARSLIANLNRLAQKVSYSNGRNIVYFNSAYISAIYSARVTEDQLRDTLNFSLVVDKINLLIGDLRSSNMPSEISNELESVLSRFGSVSTVYACPRWTDNSNKTVRQYCEEQIEKGYAKSFYLQLN